MPVKKWLIISRKNWRRLINFGKLLLEILLIAGLVIGGVWVYKSDYFRIKKITCLKDEFPCNDEIIYFADLKKLNLLTTNFNQIFNKIKDNIPAVESIKYNRHLPDEIIINLIMRQPLASFSYDQSSWYLVDTNYFVYKQVMVKPNNLPEIKISRTDYHLIVGQSIKNEVLNKVLLLIEELKTSFSYFKEIELSSSSTITVFLQESVIASFSGQKAIRPQVDSLQFILRQSKIEGKVPSFIDLRFVKPVLRY